ncbi:unnamed protein product [Cyclocybe aegerita]|uniref:Ricin B lectin domain-containing protein n=1 Tax=Cyclocybe aegerita TaxID=1973307 RepID=A0A8S0X1T3_CYCAE|nr:unnamed protein product [Cyclocybe aegerita]
MHFEKGARYIITNVKGGTAIDLDGTNNRDIIGYPKHGGPNQQWELVSVDNHDDWYLKNVRSGTYIGFDGQHFDGTKLISKSEPFTWRILPDEKDCSVYRIFVPWTNMNLDLSNHGDSKPCTPISLWGKWEGTNQTWRFEKVNQHCH